MQDVLRYGLAFLIGAIPFSQLAMLGTGINLLESGSRNPGFNNVLRVGGGRVRAAFALIGDLLKGFVALWFLVTPSDPVWMPWVLGLLAMVGHCWTPLLRFRGGKGVATMAGVMLFLDWKLALVGLILYPTLRWLGRRQGWKQEGAISSLTCTLMVTAAIYALRGPQIGHLCAILLAIIVVRHWSNLREIFE